MSDEQNRESSWREHALSRDSHVLSLMMDTISALVILLDREGNVVGFNRACQQITGFTLEELQGRPIWERLLPPDEREGVMRVFKRLRAGQLPNQYTNFWLTRGGERCLIDWTNTALVDSEGEVELVIGTGIDISARYQAELRLQESEARFRRLTEASFEGLIIHDRGDILDANAAAAALVGLTVDELVGHSAFDFLLERWHADARQSIATNRTTPYEAEVGHRDGRVIPVELLGRSVPFKGRRVRVTAVRDITARKEAEAERELLLQRELAARQEAERAVRLRDDFISVASHELRSPVTSLALALANIETLAGRVARDPSLGAALRAAAEVASRQGKRLTSMVTDLLDVTRLQSGRRRLNLHRLDLAQLVAEVVERMQPELAEAGCDVVLDAGAVTGRWDRRELERLVVNLLANASKYGAGDQVDVTVAPADDGAQLTVRDRGIGIPEDQLESIFEPYCRAVGPGKFEGVGLGLYIVRGIAEAHCGSVTVQSAPEKGARFTVTLPLECPVSGEEQAAAE